MKTNIVFKANVPLLEKEYLIDCYIISENGHISGHEISKKQLTNFKNAFYNKFLLEYGDLKMEFINSTYNSYIQKLNEFIKFEEIKERARIEQLLSKLDIETIEYLKLVKDYRNTKKKK